MTTKTEVSQVVLDYFAGLRTKQQAVDAVLAYFASSGDPSLNAQMEIPTDYTHILKLNVSNPFPWSKSMAETAAAIGNLISGSIFGIQLDMSGLTGRDIVKVDFDESTKQIQVYIKETGTPAIVIWMLAITIPLAVGGIIIMSWEYRDIRLTQIAAENNTVIAKQNTDAAAALKQYIDSGMTPEQAINTVKTVYPRLTGIRPEANILDSILPLAALGIGAYLIVNLMKGR